MLEVFGERDSVLRRVEELVECEVIVRGNEIVRAYLPEPPSAGELEQIVDQAIGETGATGIKDMGAVMGRAMALAEGRAEGRELAALVRNRLQ